MRRLAPLWAILTLILALAQPRAALAHANLVRSTPEANGSLPAAPPLVQLWFSEPPEPRFSEIALYNQAQARVQTGGVQVPPEDRSSLYVALSGLPDGVYTVVWKSVSAVDGHATTGAFAFGVGVGQQVTGPLAGVGAEVGTTTQATPLDTAVRWFGYFSLAALLGALGFVPLVLEPALNGARAPLPGAALKNGDAALWPDAVRLAIGRGTARLAQIGFWLTVASTGVAAVAQAARAANTSLLGALSPAPTGPLVTLLLATRYGQVLLGRVLLLALAAVVMSRLRVSRRPMSSRARTLWLLAAGIVALVALTTALNSHAAGVSSTQAPGAPAASVFADWVHLVATSLWVGGLFALVYALPRGYAAAGPRRTLGFLAAVVPAFSTLAIVCVAALTLTGVYQSLIQVGSFAALFGTTYGRALAVKLALVAPLLALGAFNLVITRPRLARAAIARGGKNGLDAAPARLVRAFRFAVGAEAALACGVLVAVGVMTGSQPARDAWAEATRGITLDRTADDLRLRLRADPGAAGFNQLSLLVRDARGRPVTGAEKVALILTMVEHDMGQNELVLEPQGDGWYRTSTGLTSMAGTWRAEALVRRQGRDDVRTTFELPLDYAAAAAGAAPASTASGASGTLATPIAPAAARSLVNPLALDDQTLTAGKQVFEQNCVVCHGVGGKGDGPAARAMRPPPANLTQHVTQHTEGELWWWVTNGVPGTQMPAWSSVLSDAERWQVVAYIRAAFGIATS